MVKTKKRFALCLFLALCLLCSACASAGQNSAAAVNEPTSSAAASGKILSTVPSATTAELAVPSESETAGQTSAAEETTDFLSQEAETAAGQLSAADSPETEATAVPASVPADTPASEADTADDKALTDNTADVTTAAAEPEPTAPAATAAAPVYYNKVVYDSAGGRYMFYGSDGTGTVCSTVVIPVNRYIDQCADGAPMGCEGASLLMGLWAKGHCTDMSYQQFLETMPYASDGNPNHGFVGTPYANDGDFDGINMPAVASWGARYASTADMTGCSEEDLIYQLYLGHPVVAWTSYLFGPTEPEEHWWGTYKTNGHVMLLCGFNPDTREFYIADPAPAGGEGIKWVSWSTFTGSFDVMRGAVAVW